MTETETLHAEWQRRWTPDEPAGVLELYAEDYALIDHRPAGREPIYGRAAFAELLESLFAGGNVLPRLERVLADDGRVCAYVQSWTRAGTEIGGRWQLTVGCVGLVGDGQRQRDELFEPDDLRALIACYARLGGGQGVLGDGAAERFVGEYIRHHAAHDIGAVRDLFNEAWAFTDHRANGWTATPGREGAAELVRGGRYGMPGWHMHVDEVLASTDTVVALTYTWRGPRAAMAIGAVHMVGPDGCRASDLFEAGDRDGMLARFAELT